MRGRVLTTKEKIADLTTLQLRTYLIQSNQREKRQSREWKNIYAKHVANKEYIF